MLSQISPELASTHSPLMSILYSRTSSAFGVSISWPCICLSSFNVLLGRPPVRSGSVATHTPKPTAVCHTIGRVLRLVPRLPCAEVNAGFEPPRPQNALRDLGSLGAR